MNLFRRLSNPIEWRRGGPSPLKYNRGATERFLLVDTDSPPFDPKETYFAETKATMGGKKVTLAGAPPGTVGWIDWHFMASVDPRDTIYIDYMRVRQGYQKKGTGLLLVEAFYEDVVVPSGVKYVDWGDIVHDAAWKLFLKMKDRYPKFSHHGKLR